eukprot:TRINITY_DN16952_c0_g1_i2.p1 TRINITY_DN16952_c0_g1~~TRINITY_DN16952_c0_g1_i2.p1  ORF type:complete len:423 (+),score=56.50 TRINITY_DN16952_c0_g1_i2:66-1334(+)
MAMVKGGSLLLKSAGLTVKTPPTALQKCYSSSKSSDYFMFNELIARFHRTKAKFFADSLLLMKNTVMQIDIIAAHRLKRLNSLSSLYSQLYGSERLKALMCSLTKNFRSRSRYFMLGASLFNLADWDEVRAKDNELIQYSKEIDACKDLTQKTLMCQTCQKRLRIDKEVEGVRYCQCKNAPKSVYGVRAEDSDGWTPFLERKDILVWRKEHPTMKGMYFYKMYGKFDDVSADEFINVQTDLSDFRLEWDISTAKCAIVDEKSNEGQDVYYWETIWPRFFSNRFYCCSRQLVQNIDNKTVLISRSVEHPKCQDNQSSRVVNVQGYESVLTVQPTTTSDNMGLEFSLSGFENPGVKLPESIITWVAIRGMPEFMMNLRKACIKYRTEASPKEVETYPAHQINKSTQRCDEESSTYNMNSSRIYA